MSPVVVENTPLSEESGVLTLELKNELYKSIFIHRNGKKRTMVSNLYIDKNLKHLKGFKGTFSCDNIPFWGSNDRKMFIVNLSEENKKGSHFVFIEIEKDKALYLDPLGKNLSNSFIKKSLVINGCKKITYLSKPVQSMFSTSCGLFCILFTVARVKKISPRKMLSFFNNTNLLKNDKAIPSILKKIKMYKKNN